MTIFNCDRCGKVGTNPNDFHKLKLSPQDSSSILCSNCTILEQAHYISHIYKVMEKIYNKMILLESSRNSSSIRDGDCSVNGFRELT
jgi:hypothetical protein